MCAAAGSSAAAAPFFGLGVRPRGRRRGRAVFIFPLGGHLQGEPFVVYGLGWRRLQGEPAPSGGGRGRRRAWCFLLLVLVVLFFLQHARQLLVRHHDVAVGCAVRAGAALGLAGLAALAVRECAHVVSLKTRKV